MTIKQKLLQQINSDFISTKLSFERRGFISSDTKNSVLRDITFMKREDDLICFVQFLHNHNRYVEVLFSLYSKTPNGYEGWLSQNGHAGDKEAKIIRTMIGE